MNMQYCTRCILPDTRPGLSFNDEGVCSACIGQDEKDNSIDWDSRFTDLKAIAEEAKQHSTGYDCMVPVSGGKDSWYQIIKAQELGMNVLALTWKTPGRTDIGQVNLDKMISKLGVDHIDYTINPDVERRFMKAAYERAGATGLPMHMALFHIPIRMATQMLIPLVIWGENSQLEYGGTKEERAATTLDRDWLEKHGCLQSTTMNDWVGVEGLTAQNLAAYQLPPESAFDFAPKSIFLGSFIKWSSFENTRIAEEHGFVTDDAARTGTWNFADIDCDFISLHHFLKWQKFGITRAFDNLAVQIRHGMMSRDEAIAVVHDLGLQVPERDIETFCKFVGEPVSWFWDVAETFRNKDIWHQKNGTWEISDFLIKDWEW